MQSHDVSSRINLHSIDAVQAKVIVLGDQSTGKSELISNLDSSALAVEGLRNDGFFTLIEIPPEELEGTTYPVVLKCWEHSSGVSQQEEELAFRAALFCIITLDIRDPESAHSALNKWANLKDKLAPECFLFVVGTHLDQASHRRVELPDICKACAKKDAIYMEISNSTLVNFALLRKLLKQRLNYMLYRKEAIAQRPFTPSSAFSNDGSEAAAADINATPQQQQSSHQQSAAQHTTHAAAAEEKKSSGEEGSGGGSHLRRFSQNLHAVGNAAQTAHSNHLHHGQHAAQNHGQHQQQHHHTRGHLSVPALEPNILCDSVGSILASHLGTEFWPGLEEEGEELERIGWKIGSFIEQLSTTGVTDATLATASTALLDDAFRSPQHFHQTSPAPALHLSSPPRSPGRANQQQHHAHAHAPQQHSRQSGAGSGHPTAVPPPAEEYVDSGYSLSDLRAAFEIMGLSLPASLETVTQDGAKADEANTASAGGRGTKVNASATTYLRKMTVKLPDGTSADMILDLDSNIEQQIELFLMSNSLAEDDEARQKLIGIARKVQLKYAIREGKPTPQPMAYHSRQDANKSTSSPSDSSVSVSGSAGYGGSRGRNHQLHHIQGNVPFSGGSGAGGATSNHPRSVSPVPSHDNLSLTGEGARSGGSVGGVSSSGGGGGGKGGRKVRLRIALGNGSTAEVIYRSGESAQAVTEGLAARHQLTREQAQRVYEQLSKATASLL